VARKW